MMTTHEFMKKARIPAKWWVHWYGKFSQDIPLTQTEIQKAREFNSLLDEYIWDTKSSGIADDLGMLTEKDLENLR